MEFVDTGRTNRRYYVQPILFASVDIVVVKMQKGPTILGDRFQMKWFPLIIYSWSLILNIDYPRVQVKDVTIILFNYDEWHTQLQMSKLLVWWES